ncbi:MAG TPA: hypothetical protein VHD62_05635 [Opitutaceae bacterium]|nr:hypothetical protein [Opitutaceae bacterium]
MAPTSGITTPAPSAFRPETRRGAEGFFRAAQNDAGQWWLLDSAGVPRWLKGVHGVRIAPPASDGVLPPDSGSRLRAWGFNAAGVGGDGAAGEDGLDFIATVNFCDAAPPLVAAGLRLPDVFDPQWPSLAEWHAKKICAPLATAPHLVGWVTDEDPGWAQPAGATGVGATNSAPARFGAKDGAAWRPSLLQLCLSLEPSFAAYHAAWEFVLALHGGKLEALARAWGVTLANKEVLRELTRAEMGFATRGYLRDEARWTREFARRYFSTTAAAIRAADPNHLVLGCRFRGLVGAHVLAECIYPAVDVAMPDWRELPAHAETGAAHPLLAGDVSWVTPDFLRLPTAARVLRLTSVEWMLRRGRTALERAARHPAVAGYIWNQWQDEPGEQPPFARGLIHVDGSEAREHTELLVEFNARAELIRRTAARPASP